MRSILKRISDFNMYGNEASLEENEIHDDINTFWGNVWVYLIADPTFISENSERMMKIVIFKTGTSKEHINELVENALPIINDEMFGLIAK
ncbi:hypothetical protein D3C76_1296450 [compost metagenome]